jgi:hypothetical protein
VDSHPTPIAVGQSTFLPNPPRSRTRSVQSRYPIPCLVFGRLVLALDSLTTSTHPSFPLDRFLISRSTLVLDHPPRKIRSSVRHCESTYSRLYLSDCRPDDQQERGQPAQHTCVINLISSDWISSRSKLPSVLDRILQITSPSGPESG